MVTKHTQQVLIPHAPSFVHLLNPLITRLVRLGFNIGPVSMILLTVYGRKTGQPHTTPVGLFTVAGRRYLFSTFGEVNWVRNLRSNKNIVIAHGRHTEALTAVELPLEAAAPVLREAFSPYLKSFLTRPMVQSWYHVEHATSPEDYINVARSHPVFEVVSPAR